MDKQDFEALVGGPREDGRTYQKVGVEELESFTGCTVRMKRRTAGRPTQYLPGGILTHVDPDRRFIYVKSLTNGKSYCLQTTGGSFWVLPRLDEIGAWEQFALTVNKLP